MNIGKCLPCPKHESQEALVIDQIYLPSGDKRFSAKCPVCGKHGGLRKSFHGALMSWNEAVSDTPCKMPRIMV